jgi:asparagine synthase (glutamine-hydrolysing)
MCGIAGWAGLPDTDEQTLARMCDAIAHRGPDDDGAYVEPGSVGLGFRRLSIIDLEGGHQPLHNETGSVQLTCNGEIYNFQAVRRDLEARGHRFATHSDCETIAHLYEEHGLDFLSHLRGMFAIALWDAERRRLVLARDRLGVKPLYWARVGDGLVYGSEPGAILASGRIERRADPEAIAEYLTLQYVPPPRTGFAGMSKLAPGEMLVLENGRIDVRRWWALDHATKAPATGEEALERLEALMQEATRLRMIADVPVGAFLSGGIDSSLVVSYMAEQSAHVHTFSIDFPHARYSEGSYAKEVARVYGTEHEEFLVEPDIIPTIATAVRYAGEPFADSSMIPTYLLSEMTRRRVTVALSGDGGDEAFAGYVRHRLATAADRLGPLPYVARPLHRVVAASSFNGRLARVSRGLAAVSRSRHDRYATIMAHFDPVAMQRLCRPEFLAAAGGGRAAWDDVLALPDVTGVDRYLALDTATYLPGDLLVKVDRMSMAHALEVRSPLLDHQVHEFAAALPGDLKLRRGTTKWLLKQLATRRELPEHLVHRRKQGFGLPIREWFRGELRPWIEGVLRDPGMQARGYFDSGETDRLLREHVDGRADHSYRLWNLAMLELWHREWIDGA